MKTVIFLVVVVAMLDTGEVMATESEVCDLACVRGECAFGSPPTSIHYGPDMPLGEALSQGNMYCKDCTDGYTGLLCDVPVSQCNSGIHCYHGGTCMEGETPPHCDCSKTDGFAGLFCEHKLTEQCTSPGGVPFCTNGGTCHDPRNEGIDWCKCPADFDGARCEYKSSQIQNLVPKCNLTCFNDGKCEVGLKSYKQEVLSLKPSFTKKLRHDFQHCSCPLGWTGTDCSVPEVKCGDSVCYHGSTCVEHEDPFTQKMAESCNCLDATSKNSPISKFSGEACQHESSQICIGLSDQFNGQMFCTNGGQCPSESHHPCICTDGWAGAHCELPAGQASCELKCEHGGYCRNGMKHYGQVGKYSSRISALNQTHHHFEHCACPIGFTGVKCEIVLDLCGKSAEHVCLHGSTCQEINDEHGCDCLLGQTASEKQAGEFCESVGTSICLMGVPNMNHKSNAFCTNGGACKQIVKPGEEHGGCKCSELFEGDHCETEIRLTKSTTQGDTKGSANNGRGRFATLIVVVGFICGTGIFILRRIRRTRGQATLIEVNNDWNDDELDDIEILDEIEII
eukprot:CAMPEP_0198295474 /NCGR_PEP_ID=MMETSP1449-20131203/27820_1 /TAXON_ID=420275 /ORGANISM="Attheya septentrionalis, Strain CCMP2084" /LENGTH=565 /DNA_ID=CAMNT_0043995795 /DNA_START=146 /DNA_END=1843 /DNA_ORIENTATION=-